MPRKLRKCLHFSISSGIIYQHDCENRTFMEVLFINLTNIRVNAFEGGGTMPNIKSAKKRVKVIATKTAQNKSIKSALRTAIKKAYNAIDTNADNKAEAVRLAVKKIDQATAKGILHKNTAARSKSNLVKRLNATA